MYTLIHLKGDIKFKQTLARIVIKAREYQQTVQMVHLIHNGVQGKDPQLQIQFMFIYIKRYYM